MKQYVSFQRLDIICSIQCLTQCLTELYLKRFLPDLLLIQLGGFRKGGKFSVCEHTHGALRGQGRAKPSRRSGPAVQGFAEVPSAGTVLHRELRVSAPRPEGRKSPRRSPERPHSYKVCSCSGRSHPRSGPPSRKCTRSVSRNWTI